MLSILLHSIPKILFEPIAVIALFGIITMIFAWRKKQNVVLWTLVAGILFMIFWRMVIQIVSSRYASVLIYPAIILAVYFCFHIDIFLTKAPLWIKKKSGMISWLIIGILFLSCFIKCIHWNPYENYIRHNSDLVKRDADVYENIVLLADPAHATRYQYYSGLQTIPLNELAFHENVDREKILHDTIDQYKFSYDVLYFFLNESSSLPAITAEQMKFTPREWTLFSFSYHNRKKKKVLRVYRYQNSQPIKITKTKATKITFHPGVLLNGDFETAYSEKEPAILNIKTFFKKNNLEMPIPAHALYPASWDVCWVPGYAKDSAPVVELTKNALHGKYSLSMKCRSLIGIFQPAYHPAGDYKLTFLAKAISPETTFNIAFHLYENSNYSMRRLAPIMLKPQECHSIEMILPSSVFFNFSTFALIFQLERGELLLDNVSLEKIEAKK